MKLPYQPPSDPPVIRYADDDLLIVDKPGGLLSVPGRGDDKQDCLISRLAVDWPGVLAVHRLDMSTSGLMVVARHAESHRALSRLFELRQVSKQYLADIDGELLTAAGRIDLPLICDWPNRPRQMVDFSRGKHAETGFRRLNYDALRNQSRVELTPVTGRSHQLRVHMASLGHPILGDELYGPHTLARAQRLHLHASKIGFIHPSTAQALEFFSPAPF